MQHTPNEPSNEPRNLLTVAAFSSRYPAWTPASLRALIFDADQNGLAQAGALVRLGRRVLLDESAVFRWIAAQQRKPHRTARRAPEQKAL